ncbi:MAG TPA: hypothetical protein EYP34_05825 [Chromatiaceae bacterium]|nr:hypothetical protein [Chromatiaceae bacterium]
MRLADSRKNSVLWFWLLLALLIPLFSTYGRPLQRMMKSALSSTSLALLFGFFSLLLLGGLVAWYRAQKKTWLIWHLLWLVPLFILLPLSLPLVEERLHFILFGSFGFASMLLFSPLTALAVAVAGAGLDEALQWALPDRVGDWRDVGLNVLASLGGAAAAFFGTRR